MDGKHSDPSLQRPGVLRGAGYASSRMPDPPRALDRTNEGASSLRQRQVRQEEAPLPSSDTAPFDYGAALGQQYLRQGARARPTLDVLVDQVLAQCTDKTGHSEQLPRLISGLAHGLELDRRKPAFVQRLVATVLAREAMLSQSQMQACLHALALAASSALHEPLTRVDYAQARVLEREGAPGTARWNQLSQAQAEVFLAKVGPKAAGARDDPAALPRLAAGGPLAAAWRNGSLGMYLEPLWTENLASIEGDPDSSLDAAGAPPDEAFETLERAADNESEVVGDEDGEVLDPPPPGPGPDPDAADAAPEGLATAIADAEDGIEPLAASLPHPHEALAVVATLQDLGSQPLRELAQRLSALRKGLGLPPCPQNDSPDEQADGPVLASDADYLFRLQTVVADWETDLAALQTDLLRQMDQEDTEGAEAVASAPAERLQALEAHARRYAALTRDLDKPTLDEQLDHWIVNMESARKEAAYFASLAEALDRLGLDRSQLEAAAGGRPLTSADLYRAIQARFDQRLADYDSRIEGLQTQREAEEDEARRTEWDEAISLQALGREAVLTLLRDQLFEAEDAARDAATRFREESLESGSLAYFRLGFLQDQLQAPLPATARTAGEAQD